MISNDVRVRPGRETDTGAVLALLDDAVRWLAAQGRTGQWGTEPFSTQPKRVELVQGWAAGGGLRVAEIGESVVGAMALGPALPYAPPAREPELYIQGLVTDRAHAGQGIGAVLLAEARAEAARQGLHLIRLDCWAGGDRALVRYYERAGFTPTDRITLGDWEGQILVQRC